MKNLKSKLDELVLKYETPTFIKSDPIVFLHNYKVLQDIEISGLISSSLAYGKREAFIEKLHYIHNILGSGPYNFTVNLDKKACEYYFKDFKYRFNTGADIYELLDNLYRFYNENESFDEFILSNLKAQNERAKEAVTILSEKVCNNSNSKSYCYLFPNPKTGSACKRLNLFLKWMVRKSPVDIGLWKSLKPKDLIIPLDVHVAKVSRALGLTTRKSNDWQTAEEITARLREFDPLDPVRYDFALFDIGVEKIQIY